MRIPGTIFLLTLFLLAGSLAGCGGDSVTVTSTEIDQATATRASTVRQSTVTDSGPIMPNVDESAVPAVTDAALAAFERDYGDGSGASVVWGPNVITGWALIGVENNSGAAGKDVLLSQENGVWTVKDIGHALSVNWQDKTPPGLWPSM